MPRSLARPRRGDPGEHVSDPVHASGRPSRGHLSIVRLTRHHTVLGTSPNPRGGTLGRHRTRKSVAARASESARTSAPSNGFSGAESAERPASWIKRRFYHPMVLGQLPSAQLSTCRPLIRAQKLRSILRRERLRRLDETRREPRFRLCVGRGGRYVDQATTPAPYGVTWCGRWP